MRSVVVVGLVAQEGTTYVLPRRGQAEKEGQGIVYLMGRVCRPVLKHAQLLRPYRCDEAERHHSTPQASQASGGLDLSCESVPGAQP